MTTRTTLKFGFTFDFFIPGVLLIIIGGVSYFSNFVVATGLLLFGIVLLLLRTGIEIDRNKKRVRKFYEFFSIRLGPWINTVNFPIVELRPTNESKTVQGRGSQMTFETKTYDIVFVDKSNAIRELNDFTNYDVAIKTLNLIEQTLNLESKNEVEEIRNAILKRRKDHHYK